ncbi:hypothetical protein GHT06_015442 [Daphnia sinensis]|uniref:TATA box binding protein associated factor (TAF) histone-like fold domain-containing protein n=1 Tax=Daphnia sinensis TaxID=1820382 RepID=A0AAD5LAH5_9CRUS|nr:hypothetical protein GHT06_015442 [Daphnia sinensis]
MNNDVNNEKNFDKPKTEKKFIQISPESIELIADSAGYTNLPGILSKSLAEDTSYRLRELIQSCSQILRHSKRSKLTKDDVNLALHWSDVPQVHGPNTTLEDFTYLPELDIYSSVDRVVDLTQEYPTDTDVEVYSPMKLTIQYLSLDPEDKLKTEVYFQYFEKISQSLLSTSDCVVEVALANLLENSRLQPLLPTFSGFLRNLVAFSGENSHVVKRIPKIFNALMNNSHLHIGSEYKCFLQLVQDLILNYGGAKLDESIFHLISSTLHILAKLSIDCSIHDVINNLSRIIADVDGHISVQCRALMALRCLSSKHLDTATSEHWNALLYKFYEVPQTEKNVLYLEAALISAIIDVLRCKMRLLDQITDTDDLVAEQMWNEGSEIYRVTSDILGSSVHRIGHFSPSLCRQVQRGRSEKVGDSCNELYWTLKTLHKPLPQSKWRYNLYDKPHLPAMPIDLMDVFDYSERNHLRMANITFRVRNWKQRPMHLLKKKVPQCPSASFSNFALLANSKFKCISKCYLINSTLLFNCPVDLIL